jgi:molybdate transport system substrate-binding protein
VVTQVMGRRSQRRGGSTSLVLWSVVVLAVLAGLMMWLAGGTRGPAASGQTLVVYCAAGVRPPVEQIAQQYEEEYDVPIRLQYGPSGGLESQLQINPNADLFIPAAADPFLVRGRKKGEIAETIPLAKLQVVLAVRPGLATEIGSLDDLVRKKIRYALANEQAAVGRLTVALLEKCGQWERVRREARVFKGTVTDVANDVALGGDVDAGFVWDSTAKQFGLEIVQLPELSGGETTITAGVVATSKQPTAALRFARYLAAPNKGGRAWSEMHYRPVSGDPWAFRPKITLFSGGVNRVAIQETLKDFQRREGCDVTVVYNGCGILVGMMKTGQQPDAYFACDVSFVEQVREQFLEPLDVSETDMVILVRRGNPKKIRTLDDLARPDAKIGLADEKLSALGALTKRLLEEAGLYQRVVENRRVSSPTADFLVTQLLAHDELDAVIVYAANCANVGDEAEVVRVDHPLAHAVQPFAIHRNDKYPQLTARLLDALTSAASRARFEAVGFRWRVDQRNVRQDGRP